MFSFKKDKNVVENNGDDASDIGKFIKSTRLEKGLTQLQLGNILDVSPKTISKWENNNGFPDPLYQMPLCETLEITLEELHSGRLNIEKRNKEKKETRIKFMLVFFIGVLLIIIVILFGLLIYYKHFYNPLTLYYVDVTNEKQTTCKIAGYHIKDRNINMLYIGYIQPLSDNITDNDLIEVSFLYDNKIIYTSSSFKNISINLSDNINPQDILVKIIVKDLDTKKIKYNEDFKIRINEIETISKGLEFDLNTELFIKGLENMGFKKIDNNTYKFENNSQEVIYNIKNKTILINTFGNNKFMINYNMVSNDIYVSLTSNVNGRYIMTEKYSYSIFNKNLANDIGYGYSLNNVLKMLDPYISLRNRYLISTN